MYFLLLKKSFLVDNKIFIFTHEQKMNILTSLAL